MSGRPNPIDSALDALPPGMVHDGLDAERGDTHGDTHHATRNLAGDKEVETVELADRKELYLVKRGWHHTSH